MRLLILSCAAWADTGLPDEAPIDVVSEVIQYDHASIESSILDCSASEQLESTPFCTGLRFDEVTGDCTYTCFATEITTVYEEEG